MTRLSGRSPKLAAFVAFAGPLDLLTRFARRSLTPLRAVARPRGAKRRSAARDSAVSRASPGWRRRAHERSEGVIVDAGGGSTN